MRELFFETSQELLQSLNDEALKLEKQPGDVEIVRSIRRIVHTLKGDAAACGFRELSNAAHELEDALALQSACTHSSLAEVAFTAADTFGEMIAVYRRKSKAPSGEGLRKIVRALGQNPTAKKSSKRVGTTTSGAVTWNEYEHVAAQNAANYGRNVYHVTATVDPHCAMPIAARQLTLNALNGAGEVLAARPDGVASGPVRQFDFLMASLRTAEQLIAICRIPTIIAHANAELVQAATQKGDTPLCQPEAPLGHPLAEVQGPSSTQSKLDSPEENESASRTHLAENVLRVDAERIDNVLNLVGELIIGKSMLQQAFSELAKHFPKEAMRGRFGDAMAFQSRVLSDLQRSVMKIRMVPVEQLFRRFPRLVRDVARQCGKEVELAISGEDTDLDKSLLDAIAEPLTHLVRNAIGHGIERAEERTRSGKPAQGTLRLSSYHHGNQVIVEVSDDGRGIDVQKIKAKAVQQGLISSDEASRLSEAEILELVFRPGFSTAEEVTEISGRGVGLDVVQAVLHRLKGTVEIATRAGKGTTFRLKLPLTLAIIKALLFRVEQRLYAIPLNAVAQISRAHESELHRVDSHEVLQLRNQVLPLVRLGHRPTEQSGHEDKIFVLVIAFGERKLGLIVDALEGEEELVIKALDDQTVSTDLVSGASILGDGRVVLIINLPAIVDRHSKHRPNETGDLLSGILLAHSDGSPKPQDVSARMPQIAQELISKIKAAGQSRGVRMAPMPELHPRSEKLSIDTKKIPARVIAIGVSTGGPQALQYVLSQLPPDFPGSIVVVQHMPEGFTEMFARRLDEICSIGVKEAQSGDLLLAGRVLICPGSRHLKVKRLPLGDVAVLSDDPRVNGHRPSADVLFKSLAEEFGPKGIAVLMTGMGDDGAQGMGTVKAAGGMTIAQNEESCVVFGMPKAAIDRGYAIRVVALDALANTLMAQCTQDRKAATDPNDGIAAGAGR